MVLLLLQISVVELEPGTTRCAGEARIHPGGNLRGELATVPLEFEVRIEEVEGGLRMSCSYIGLWGLPEAQLLQFPEESREAMRPEFGVCDLLQRTDDGYLVLRQVWPDVGSTVEYVEPWMLWRRAIEGSWGANIDLADGSESATWTCDAEAQEELTIGDRAVMAVPVRFRMDSSDGGHGVRGTTWFESGGGPVRQSYEFQNHGHVEIAVEWTVTP